MSTRLADRWWLLVLRGLAGIVFGVLAFAWPGLTLFVLTLFVGAYFFVDGICAAAHAFSRDATGSRAWLVLEAISGIAIGLITLFYPGVTELMLLLFIAAWLVVTGIAQVVTAIQLRKTIKGEWALVLSGVLSVIVGIVFFLFMNLEALSVVWLIAAYAIVTGLLLILAAFRVRGATEMLGGAAEGAATGT